MQTVTDAHITRTEHVWYFRDDKEDWKCVICGGVSKNPKQIGGRELPERHERLTCRERRMRPYVPKHPLGITDIDGVEP